MGPSGRLLGPSWGALGPSWGALGAILEEIDQKRGVLNSRPPSGAPKIASWGALGTLVGALGAVLGLYWASLGALLGNLEASDGHRKRKGETAKSIELTALQRSLYDSRK